MFFMNNHVMKTYGEEVQLQTFITSATYELHRPVSRIGRCTPDEKSCGTNRRVGWVGPRACLGAVAKCNISFLCQESNPGSLCRSRVIIEIEPLNPSLYSVCGEVKLSLRQTVEAQNVVRRRGSHIL
jgi:hypothetical protein